MPEFVFRVRRVVGGWIVDRGEGGDRIGGLTDRASALDLAQGMAAAIVRTGGVARVVIDGG